MRKKITWDEFIRLELEELREAPEIMDGDNYVTCEECLAKENVLFGNKCCECASTCSTYSGGILTIWYPSGLVYHTKPRALFSVQCSDVQPNGDQVP